MTRKGALFGALIAAAPAALFPKAHTLQFAFALLLASSLLLVLLAAGLYLKNKFARRRRLSWQLPLAGYIVTFLVAAGLSLSNENIRTQVEIVGLGAWAVFSVIGFIFTFIAFYRSKNETRWRTNAIAGLTCNLLLASLSRRAH